MLDWFFSVDSVLISSSESRFCSRSYFSQEWVLRILLFIPSIRSNFICIILNSGIFEVPVTISYQSANNEFLRMYLCYLSYNKSSVLFLLG